MTDTQDLKTEQKILEAAKNVFVQRGLDGARMEDIAKEAGINKALLHYYFRSKDRLFETVLGKIGDKFVPNLASILESDAPTMDKIEAIVSRYIDFLSEHPQMPLFLITELSRNPERMKTLMTQVPVFNKMQQFGVQLIAEMQTGKIKSFNPLHLTLNILAMCIFPFAARPMVQTILKVSDEDYQLILSQRKTEIIHFLKEALQP